MMLSPGWLSTVTAEPPSRTSCWIGRRSTPAKPTRPIASCTVAVPAAPSACTTAGSARSISRTTTFRFISCSDLQPREDPLHVELEDLTPLGVGQVGAFDVLAGVVVVLAGVG